MAAENKSLQNSSSSPQSAGVPIERVQLGVRIEKRMVKVLKALAELHDVTLGELIEDMVLHEFEGEGACAFRPESLAVIADLKRVYGMDYDVHTNYRFVEKNAATATANEP